MSEKEAIKNVRFDFCQDCNWYISEENEYYDKCDPDPIVTWCGYNKSGNKGYCGLKTILKKYMSEKELISEFVERLNLLINDYSNDRLGMSLIEEITEIKDEYEEKLK